MLHQLFINRQELPMQATAERLILDLVHFLEIQIVHHRPRLEGHAPLLIPAKEHPVIVWSLADALILSNNYTTKPACRYTLFPNFTKRRGLHCYPSTHSSPLGATSFFQIGTVVLSVSIT